jgi:hypothetical protein
VQTQTFTPDDIYCAYCHAPAAGPCAACGALCCADCVEIAMGLTVQRAVCKPCLAKGAHAPGATARRWVRTLLVGLALVAVAGALLLLE